MAGEGIVYIYVTIIFLGLLVVNYFFIKKKNTSKETGYIRNVTIWAALCMLDNVVIALNSSLTYAYPLFAIYFAGIDILLISFVRYMIFYTGETGSLFLRKFAGVLMIVAAIDVISLNVNTLTHHCFLLERFQSEQGQVYFVNVAFWPYNLHLYFDYFLILLMFVMLIRKAAGVARIYRVRYLSYVVALLIIVVVNVAYMFFNLRNDWSVCLYGLFILITSNISSSYTYDKLRTVMLHRIIDEMDDGILIFDENGDNIYANALAMRILDTDDMETITVNDAMEKYLLEGEVSDDGITIRKDERGVRFYRVFIEKITENKDMEVGSFFIMRDVTQPMMLISQEREKNHTDTLTGLMNKEYFMEQAEEVLRKRTKEKYLIICSNFENFRLLNRLFGRRKGDEILASTAQLFVECSDKGIYGRMGSDCFAALLPIEFYNEKMFLEFTYTVDRLVEHSHFTMHVMIGVYEIKDSSVPVSVMCDKALLASRQLSGTSRRIIYHNEEIERRIAGEQVYAVRLFDAILNGEIKMMLQPVVSVDGSVLGAEGLVRWFRPDGKIIMPEEFIDFFEQTGQIYRLDQHMWREAVKELRRWKDMGREDLFVSVNVTGRDLNQADIYDYLTGLAEEFNVKKENLHLEIADISSYRNKDNQKLVIDRLKKSGFVVWMDNFGSAYASVDLLRQLKVSAIKVDMGILYDPDDKEKSGEIVEAIIHVAKSMGMEIVPERVSDEDIFMLIKKLGCRMYQGNYFDMAIKPEEFIKRYI